MSSIVRTLIMAKKRGFLPKEKTKYSAKDHMKRHTREKEMNEGACAHGEQEMTCGHCAAIKLFKRKLKERNQSGYWAEKRKIAKLKYEKAMSEGIAKLKYEKAMSEGARSHGEQELQHPTDSRPPSDK